MSIDRRAEAASGLEEVIAARGYTVTPLLMRPTSETEYSSGGWEAAEIPLNDRYRYVCLGLMEPPLRDPFNPEYEARFGQFLFYDPSVMDVAISTPLNGNGREVLESLNEHRRSIGFAILETDRKDLSVVAIRRKLTG